MKFSLVMPTCNDFHGVAFTLKAAQMYHGDFIDDYVVVDNCEHGSKHSPHVRTFTQSMGGRYFNLVSCKGTACAKNEAIKQAKNDWVICLDSHVLLYDLSKLYQYVNGMDPFVDDDGFNVISDATKCKADERKKTLIHGPIMQDTGDVMATHFDAKWRGEMYGIWAFDEEKYKAGQPFEIPGMGMGMFAVNKNFWPGFHKDFMGFGGEEMYIHEKYRQLGGKVICIPQFKWWHRFARPDGQGYHHTIDEKCYNYVVGWNDLGLPLGPIHDTFIKSGLLSESRWKEILQGWKPPVGQAQPATGGCTGCNKKNARLTYEQLVETASDINEHLPTIMQLAKSCSVVVGCGMREDVQEAVRAGHQVSGLGTCKLHVHTGPEASTNCDLIDNEMLFVDNDPHTADQVYKELKHHVASCKRYIVLHDTQVYGESYNGQPGILPAVRRFQSEHPEFVTVAHYDNNNGLTVLSCNPQDYPPELPPLLRRVKNFALSTAKHIANGGKLALPTVQEQRLDICTSNGGRCPAGKRILSTNHCSVCGCPLAEKVKRPLDVCPLGYWQETEEVE